MYCTRCGTRNSDGTRFCTSCGASTELGGNPGGTGYSQATAASSYPSPSYPSAVPRMRLRRVMSEKKIAGVCAGFAEYFDMDLTLVRLLWLGFTLMTGIVPGLMVYVVAWIILPTS